MRITMLAVMGVLLAGCTIVSPGTLGIRVSLGEMASTASPPGFYFSFPPFTHMKRLDVRIQKSDVKTSAASKDMQEVTTELAINWNLDGAKVLETYRRVGDEEVLLVNIITPAVSEVLKACTAHLTAEEILTKRMELKAAIDEGLRVRLSNYGIELQDVNIVNLAFSHDFTKAIEDKQIAEQAAKKAEYVAVMAEKEAVAAVNRAQGEARAQALLKSTITAEILQKMAIEKWDGSFPQVMGTATLPFINVTPEAKK